MEVFGDLIAPQGTYRHAYELCEEILTVFALAIAAMWVHITWMRHQDAKRQEKAVEMLARLIATIENRPSRDG